MKNHGPPSEVLYSSKVDHVSVHKPESRSFPSSQSSRKKPEVTWFHRNAGVIKTGDPLEWQCFDEIILFFNSCIKQMNTVFDYCSGF